MNDYIEEVEQRIAEDEFDGLFTSDQIIDNSGFVDLLFIGEYKGKPVVWNTCITTSQGDYYDKVDGIAMEDAYIKYPDPEGYDLFDHFEEIPDSNYSKWVDPNPELSFKRYRYMSEKIMELLDSGTIKITPWNIDIDESYEYGVGLHIRMNIERINIDDVKNFVKRFKKLGINCFNGLRNSPIAWTSEELGVELKDGEKFISWKNGRLDIVGVDETKINSELLGEDYEDV